jgi:hypothetical protein
VRLRPVETSAPVRGRLNNAGRFFMTFAYQKVILLAAEIAVPNPPTFGARNYPRESWEVPRFYPAGGYSPLFATARNKGREGPPLTLSTLPGSVLLCSPGRDPYHNAGTLPRSAPDLEGAA